MERLEDKLDNGSHWKRDLGILVVGGALLIGLSGCYHHSRRYVSPRPTNYEQHVPSERHRLMQAPRDRSYKRDRSYNAPRRHYGAPRPQLHHKYQLHQRSDSPRRR